MSLGDDPIRHQARLRALAHPARLQILSLLTGAALTAAEVARELGLTHANASYHLRHLLAGGIIVIAGEERIRGGVAKRYRYDVDAERDRSAPATDARRAIPVAFAGELRRRSELMNREPGTFFSDAELWVDPEVWRDVRDRIAQASADLHRAAQAPRAAGTIRTSTTLALFEMENPS